MEGALEIIAQQDPRGGRRDRGQHQEQTVAPGFAIAAEQAAGQRESLTR